MGEFHFLLPESGAGGERIAAEAYLANPEGIPWRTRNTFSPEQGLLQAACGSEESGQLHAPWRSAERGPLMLATTTLMQRGRPYRLSVELARGALHRLRAYLAAGEGARAPFSQEVYGFTGKAGEALAGAVTARDPARAEQLAAQAIEAALAAGRLLVRQYAAHVLPGRLRDGAKLNLPLAVDLGDVVPDAATAARLAEGFNTVAVPLTWRDVSDDEGTYRWDRFDRQVQAARQAGLRVCLGPLLALDRRSVPDWLCLWEEDFESLEQYVVQYVEAVVRRYQKHVAVWHVAGRLNVDNPLSLGDEDLLRLALAAAAAVRRFDSRTPTLVSLDQPWAEYMGRQGGEMSPLHMADWLARSEVGISGIGLEMNFGAVGGGPRRDLLEIASLLDRWALLGKPLVAFLTTPGADDGGSPTAEAQAEGAEELALLLLSRPQVQAILWNQLVDSPTGRHPRAGLLDSRGRPKPAWNRLVELRRQFIV